VLPYCSAVITHGGHGTVMKALIAGVPLVVVPLGRDQPGNAARVIRAGAGLRLRKNASVSALRAAVARVTEDPGYRAAARRMADRLAAIFPDFTLETFPERHHFDPPHRVEPDRLADSLLALWGRAEPSIRAS